MATLLVGLITFLISAYTARRYDAYFRQPHLALEAPVEWVVEVVTEVVTQYVSVAVPAETPEVTSPPVTDLVLVRRPRVQAQQEPWWIPLLQALIEIILWVIFLKLCLMKWGRDVEAAAPDENNDDDDDQDPQNANQPQNQQDDLQPEDIPLPKSPTPPSTAVVLWTMQSLQNEIRDLQTRIEALTGRRHMLEDRNTDLEEQYRKYMKTRDGLVKEYNTGMRHKTILENEISELAEQLHYRDAENATLAGEIWSLKEQMEAEKAKKKTLESELSTLKDDIEAQKARKKTTESEVSKLNNDIEVQNAKKKTMADEIEEIREKKNIARFTWNLGEDERERIKSRTEALKKENEALESERASLGQEFDGLRRIRTFQEDNERLQRELDECREAQTAQPEAHQQFGFSTIQSIDLQPQNPPHSQQQQQSSNATIESLRAQLAAANEATRAAQVALTSADRERVQAQNERTEAEHQLKDCQKSRDAQVEEQKKDQLEKQKVRDRRLEQEAVEKRLREEHEARIRELEARN